jgi:hypothetical protein
MAYELKEFTKESLSATINIWTNEMVEAKNVFPGDYIRVIEFVEQCHDHTVKGLESLAYGIFDGDSLVADSIVEVIVSKTSRKLIKMLDCHIRPALADKAYAKVDDVIAKLVEIYAVTITGTISLASTHKVDTVKVFGRSNDLMTVLGIACGHLQRDSKDFGIEVGFEGRWLVVKSK